MHHARQPTAHAERHHHVSELADRRISQDAFDVRRGDRNRRRNEQGDHTGNRNDEQHFGREDGVETPDQIHAGGNHRGRVNECGDRSGAFHRVGQPHVQRELSTLADTSAKDPDAREYQQPVSVTTLSPVGGSERRFHVRRRDGYGIVVEQSLILVKQCGDLVFRR